MTMTTNQAKQVHCESRGFSRRAFLATQGCAVGAVAVAPSIATASQTAGAFAVAVNDYGAAGDGITDDTFAIQDAVSSLEATGGSVLLPPGEYLLTETLKVGNDVQLIGAGRGATRLRFDIDGLQPGIGRADSVTGTWKHLCIRDLTVTGTVSATRGGSEAYGIELDSAAGALIQNVSIEKFRAVSGLGQGLRLVNTSHGGCYRCTFEHVTISDCDTGLFMDCLDSTYMCGLMTFVGLSIWQERDCIVLKRSQENGSSYNTFTSTFLQAGSGGRHFIVIEGSANYFDTLVIDDPGRLPGTYHVWYRHDENLARPTSNYLGWGGYDPQRIRNDNPGGIGGFNTFFNATTFAGGGATPVYLNGSHVADALV